jgi:hypothetical protein
MEENGSGGTQTSAISPIRHLHAWRMPGHGDGFDDEEHFGDAGGHAARHFVYPRRPFRAERGGGATGRRIVEMG